MADNAPAVKTPKKKAAAKPKKPADHPKYSEMVASAVSALKERGGSSRQAILKYILKNYNVGKDERKVNSRVKLALRAGVTNGALKQSKGTGASGSFRLGEVKAKKAKKAKPAAKKAKSPKKAKTPKKEKKSPKKASKPKGEKKAAKPKKAKSPAKKSPAKKATKAAKPKKVSKPAAKKSPAKKTAKAAKPKVKKAAAKKK